ncbi:MAG: TIGR02147 family protein [Fibrobacteres bacterium]|nr:TIGR02147 family protein [Fibrobacterota bacterium]
METQKLPNIFEYNDFRKFLADLQKAKQSEDPRFNKSNLSKLLGLPNTRSYFTDVLAGRNVTPSFVERFVSVFALEKEEERYFRALVKFNQAETSEEKELCLDQLISLNRTPKKLMEKRAFQYYQNWYNGTIRALLSITEIKDDFALLAKKVFPPITPKQARESITLLKQLELISVDSEGNWRPTEKSITTPDYIKDELIKQYQAHSIELAKWCVLKNTNIPQVIATNVISISDKGYARLEKKIQRFRSEVRSLVHKDEEKAQKVYHLDILFFPNSK